MFVEQLGHALGMQRPAGCIGEQVVVGRLGDLQGEQLQMLENPPRTVQSDLATIAASSSRGSNTGMVALAKSRPLRVTMALTPAACAAS